jgi:hypothetical protein
MINKDKLKKALKYLEKEAGVDVMTYKENKLLIDGWMTYDQLEQFIKLLEVE